MSKKINKKESQRLSDAIKMSEVIADFAEPLLREAVDEESAEIAISMAVTCWNLSLLHKDEQAELVFETVWKR